MSGNGPVYQIQQSFRGGWIPIAETENERLIMANWKKIRPKAGLESYQHGYRLIAIVEGNVKIIDAV